MDNSADQGTGRLLERQVEALLFASDLPLKPEKIKELTSANSNGEVREAVSSLSEFYNKEDRSFEIVELAGGYQIVTLPEYSEIIKSLYKNRRKSRLSRAALETLAIIAYKQPVSRAQIEAVRGVNSGGVLSTLTERELIRVSGRGESLGKPFLYSTTRQFLEYLGLKNYNDLPSIDEFASEGEAIRLLESRIEENSPDEKAGDEKEGEAEVITAEKDE
ncbi:MAG: SMC-Scp complex subunit ScpB [Candidatus Latescibacteria bacterium]|nr:SMC-Scp complex subunit ScpB [bacterium]MBD3425108.1 SMC-Scp complex subunit ScpB [Candidatus Latescibacterota bacterium]